MTTKDILNRIGDLIGKDDLGDAIKELRNILDNSDKLNELIMQSARFNDLSKQIRLGTINFEDANITKNKIRFAILGMITDIEEGIESNPDIEKELDNVLKGSEITAENFEAENIKIKAEQINSKAKFGNLKANGIIEIDIKQE